MELLLFASNRKENQWSRATTLHLIEMLQSHPVSLLDILPILTNLKRVNWLEKKAWATYYRCF